MESITLKLNDTDFSIKLFDDINNPGLYDFLYEKKYAHLKEHTIIDYSSEHPTLKIFDKPVAIIENNEVRILNNNFTSTELRAKYFNDKESTFDKEVNVSEYSIKTELHTHLIEILDGESFFQFLKDNDVKINFDINTNMAVSGETSMEEIEANKEMYDSFLAKLSLPFDKRSNFFDLEDVVSYRTSLFNIVSDNLNLSNPIREGEKANINRARALKRLLEYSLIYLKNQGIKYVEISYSNDSVLNTLETILDNDFYENIDGIKFNFLLSTSRERKKLEFKNSSKGLKKALKGKIVTGFDIMGTETTIYDVDLIPNRDTSIYDKLEMILKVLVETEHQHPVFRLHSGEFAIPVCDGNTEKLLDVIDRIAAIHNWIIPPPEIRIGHGLHFNNNEHYLELLKKFNVIIEINASSNFALSNIDEIRNIPYKYYLDNGIDIVIATDGGGAYGTTSKQELQIASLVLPSEIVDKILSIDSKILEEKESVVKSK